MKKKQQSTKYNNKYDDKKTLNRIYYSELKSYYDEIEKKDKNQRFANMIIKEEKFLTETDKAILHKTVGDKQKITAILYLDNDENKIARLYISRRTSKDRLYDYQVVSLSGDSINILYDFLSKVCSYKLSQKKSVDLNDKTLLPSSFQATQPYNRESCKKNLEQYSKKDLFNFLAEKENLTPDDCISFLFNIKKINLSDIQLAIELKEKKESLEKFKSRLDKKGFYEDKGDDNWQNWFSLNKWIFGSDYVEILKERKIDSHSIADSLAKSYGNFLDIIEIKSPTLNDGKLFREVETKNKKKKYFYPTAQLTKAVSQCFRYIHRLEKQIGDPEHHKKFENCEILKPRCTLIFGRSNDFKPEEYKALRILNAHYNSFSILTYDQLYARAKKMLEIMEIKNNNIKQDN